MTRHTYTRCRHCSAVFVFQSSGQKVNWYPDQSDSSDYCKLCWAVVCAALEPIPRRCESFYEDVTDQADLDKVFAKEDHDKEHPKMFMGMPVREVGGSLFKMEGNKVVATMHATVVYVDTVRHSIERWSDDSKPVKVVRMMERDTQTGKTQPWKKYA